MYAAPFAVIVCPSFFASTLQDFINNIEALSYKEMKFSSRG